MGKIQEKVWISCDHYQSRNDEWWWWCGVRDDQVKWSGKSGRMSLEDLSTTIEKIELFICQLSQSITYQHRHNVLTFLLWDPRKSFILGLSKARGRGLSLTLFHKNWDKTYLNNSWNLQPQIREHFLELVTQLDYVNPIKSQLFQHHLNNFSSKNMQFCVKIVKTPRVFCR